jgi:hypothetical protein
MRIRMRPVLGVLLAVAVAAVTGCGRSGGTPGVATAHSGAAASASSTPGLSDQDKALKFGQCMRDNGVPDFKDPKVGDNGGIGIEAPNGADPAKVEAAMQKCKQYLPGGGQPKKADPQVVEQLRKYAQCMRDNGIKNFPDPTDEGLQVDPNKLGITGRPEDDPKYAAAAKTCSKYQPGGPSGGPSGGGLQTQNEGN